MTREAENMIRKLAARERRIELALWRIKAAAKDQRIEGVAHRALVSLIHEECRKALGIPEEQRDGK